MIDLFSEQMRREPYPAYEHMRRHAPLLHDERSGMWMLFDYEGVRRALADHDSFGSSLLTAGQPTPPWLFFFDPPLHTKLRGLVTQAFVPAAIARLEPRIARLARDLVDRSIERGEMDLADDFSVPLAITVIAELIGIPAADWPRFRRWSEGILKLVLTMPGADAADVAEGMSEYRKVDGELKEYLPELIEQRRVDPRDDLLSRLVQAEVDGQRLNAADLHGFFQVLLVAGNETTTNLVNNAILCLTANPDQLARLRERMDLLPSAIEEVLRYRSPFQFVFRATRRDVELHGQPIPAGKLVLAMIGSANRDETQFRDADRFDIERDPNPHVAFGHGIHFCLGATLARLEARVALTELLLRLEGLELASAEPWEPRRAMHVHGPTHLPVRFRAAKSGVILEPA